MYNNGLVDLLHQVQAQLWVDKLNKAHERGQLCPWVSTFHPKRLACRLEGTFHHGSFNAGVKMVFSDGTAWMVRFPRVGKVHDEYADEKVAMEVRALSLIRERTTIPVPEIQAWGSAADNSLGLGAFIMMDFVNGVCLNDLLTDPNEAEPTRLLREDISDGDMEVIYRQFANFLLQLFNLDFDSIGSLPSPEAEPESLMPKRPLTYKAHDILHNGGVDVFGTAYRSHVPSHSCTFSPQGPILIECLNWETRSLGDRRQGFATTTEYFQYILGQDFGQLTHQPNSIYGPHDARSRYLAFEVLKSLLPDLINEKYDGGKFKLICDDLGLANLIVRSKEDLTVVGVVDLEWSYVGPAQLFGSAPWWLLQDRPINEEWEWQDGKPPKLAERYFKYLDIYKRVLEEEEAKMSGYEERELSNLVKWSQESGAMWLHMLISVGFNDHRSFPFTQLRQHVGETKWERRVRPSLGRYQKLRPLWRRRRFSWKNMKQPRTSCRATKRS
jgi:aminoglycoside phosphotransferase (APT) family kinase protein